MGEEKTFFSKNVRMRNFFANEDIVEWSLKLQGDSYSIYSRRSLGSAFFGSFVDLGMRKNFPSMHEWLVFSNSMVRIFEYAQFLVDGIGSLSILSYSDLS